MKLNFLGQLKEENAKYDSDRQTNDRPEGDGVYVNYDFEFDNEVIKIVKIFMI